MLNKKLKKVIASVTMFATVLCFSSVSMLALPLSAQAATAIVDGDIVKTNAINSDGTPSISSLDVYIVKTVGSKKFKRLVLNPNIFASYSHLKWENLKTVSQAEIDVYTTSSLVRVDGNDKVYAITPVTGGDTGAKSWINLTAAQFLSLPQSDPDSIYTINSVDGAAYSAKVDITTVAQLTAFYATGALPDETPVITSDLTVSLLASTPQSMNIPKGSMVDFADFKLAAGANAVSISSITVSASGLGDDADFTNIALYLDGAKVGNSKTGINTSREATFNFSTPIKISANASKTLTIKATVDGTSTYKLGIKEAADVITSGGTVAGSFPIYGNAMSAVTNNSIGEVVLSAENDVPAPGTSFGTDGVLLAGFTLTANREGALLSSIRLKNAGTNVAGIIDNLTLNIDGEKVADGTYDSSTGYVDFNISGNKEIKKSGKVVVEVYGDMGTTTVGNTVNLYIKSIDDLAFVGETYGFGIQLTAASYVNLDEAGEGIVVTMATGDVSIDMNRAATPDKNVKQDADGVVLATFSVTSNGENATINSIGATGSANFQIKGSGLTNDDFSNIVMVDKANGATYDLSAGTKTATAWNLFTSEEISLVKGVKKTFEIKADFASDMAIGATAKIYIAAAAMTITGDDSDHAISDITPSTVTSATATVKAASLDFTTSALSAKSVVPGVSDVSVYQATLEAGTVDDVKLSSVTLTKIAGGDAFTNANISQLDLYLGGKLIKSTSNQIAGGNSITFSSLITTGDANVIKAGESVLLEAKANFALAAGTSFALEASDTVIARDAVDNGVIDVTMTPNGAVGSRVINVASQGNLKVELLTTSSKDSNAMLLAGTTSGSGKYLGEVKFTTSNENVTLTELALSNSGDATIADIAEVQLVDVLGVVVASKIPDTTGNVDFTNLSLVLPADGPTSYFIAVKAKGMNVNGDAASTARQNKYAIYHITDVTVNGVNSTSDIPMVVNPVAAAQVNIVTPTPANTTVYTVVINGTTIASAASDADATAAEIVALMITAINGSAQNAAVTATGTDTCIITSDVVGTAFTITAGANLANAVSVVNNSVVPGVGEFPAATVITNRNVVSGSVLNSVVSALPNGTLVGGKQIIGKYTLTFENGSNRTTSNEELKAILKTLKIKVNLGGATIATDGTAIQLSAYVDTFASNVATSGVIDGSVFIFDAAELAHLVDSAKMDGAVTLVITANVLTANATDYVQTSIVDANTDIEYYGDGVTGEVADNYLAVSEVTGGTLSR